MLLYSYFYLFVYRSFELCIDTCDDFARCYVDQSYVACSGRFLFGSDNLITGSELYTYAG